MSCVKYTANKVARSQLADVRELSVILPPPVKKYMYLDAHDDCEMFNNCFVSLKLLYFWNGRNTMFIFVLGNARFNVYCCLEHLERLPGFGGLNSGSKQK